MNNLIILVDENDKPIGVEEKLKAHQNANLHRAFSIFVFNNKNQLLLQQRALNKYHSGGLWTNTCCSHPMPGEDTINSAHRRLKEEMGFDTELVEAFSFRYKAAFDNGLTENEFDHVFIGKHNNDPIPNLSEVNTYKWVDVKWLEQDMQDNKEIYTAWLKICFKKMLDYIKID
ncbi:MAG: Isopentenyl-diphosphate Delta-isomerase [Parcubacteria group bacterium GW2011_GWF1_40_6]|uniref:Isopentenyl-diphosphate delta-isomerase n=2 Tax=Candidatus Nomuraibacteriota TaxID=1752729 RepID=A0A0G0T897_9BACT|nr:MAG: Isopentenyl-diphosphate Delta-isomerase [Candidatus Nomurabacteria bacterium GW2011_GWF2_40_12]KKR69740.1 MAG: Isopentenyl-diphosphate Delta-isomerase [Parcubacteria group bacterium GW2011_GWF1_40_6]OGJ10059.1 MAG: isopentenyl-diphosphate delta-isomerase [Candidatus Nomurabacteria bacterium RIFOXYB1_FULL_39_16]OGJ15495.1 MAG: isopentenyl-diphosphate delta-isomerase [Candidatus Nomurabacteria bacterium RIFOXYD1_FULL_39_12]